MAGSAASLCAPIPGPPFPGSAQSAQTPIGDPDDDDWEDDDDLDDDEDDGEDDEEEPMQLARCRAVSVR